jgi:DNA replicative helicase MCM subunit Mcm2 (Cdc46/Mcm family)
LFVAQAAIDPVTGTLDMDLITTGRSATSRARMADLTRAVRALLEEQEVETELLVLVL